ncbi:hypothetical protein [Halomarina pelagica]|uniref:hypothetical protein n=1 Tax=Halomarina pelagica TaxID=2961599 RepID=UPI0020C598E4|nr:hypothetical protein [Halomarina sp. BND7]
MPSDSRSGATRSRAEASSDSGDDRSPESIGVFALVVIAALVVVAAAAAVALWTLPGLLGGADGGPGAPDAGEPVDAFVGNETPAEGPPSPPTASPSDDRTGERERLSPKTASPATESTSTATSTPSGTPESTPTPARTATPTPEPTPAPPSERTPASSEPSSPPASPSPSTPSTPSTSPLPSAPEVPDFLDGADEGSLLDGHDGDRRGGYGEKWGVPEGEAAVSTSDGRDGGAAGELEWQNASSENTL